MRTLLEIIEDAKDGKMPSQKECYYALLAYEAMFNIDHGKLLDELTRDKPRLEPFRKALAENSFQMYKGALNKSPKEWLGQNNDPMTPECQERRRKALKIFEKFEKINQPAD